MSKSQKHDDKQILSKLATDFHELVTNKESLRTSMDSFLNNVIDELTLGIIFDLHRKHKTNSYEIVKQEQDNDDESQANTVDVFAHYDIKKAQDCVCRICDRSVAPAKFAPHLASCMGIGRQSTSVPRRVASNATRSKDREESSFSGVPSDDDDDKDWNSGHKGRKKKKRTGNKKPKGGTPKKSGEIKPDSTNIEIEVDETDLNLRDLLQDHSNSSSPAESVSSSHSNNSLKKKDKTKNKKNKKDRSSPSSSLE